MHGDAESMAGLTDEPNGDGSMTLEVGGTAQEPLATAKGGKNFDGNFHPSLVYWIVAVSGDARTVLEDFCISGRGCREVLAAAVDVITRHLD